MEKNCRCVRLNREPFVRRSDNPGASNPRHLVYHPPLVLFLADVLYHRVRECEINVVVWKRHVTGVSNHKGVVCNRWLDVNAHLYFEAISNSALYDISIRQITETGALVPQRANEQNIFDIPLT